jgi:hypothetical protein
MRTLLLITLIYFIAIFSANAQTCVWGKGFGGGGGDAGRDIAIDSSGNIYTIGTVTGSADLDPGPNILLSDSVNCATTVYINKLDKEGNLIWAKSYLCGDHFNDDKIYSIKLDHSGNLIIAGSFAGTTDFDPGPGTFYLTPNGGASDIFISKLTSNGDFIWAKSIGSTYHDDFCYALTVDASDNIIYGGQIRDASADLDPGPGVFSPTGEGYGFFFISKLSKDGDFIWARRSIAGSPTCHSLSVDNSGNIICIGNFYFTVDFGPNSGTFHAVSQPDVFVLKLDAAGNFIFAKQFSGESASIVLGYASGVADPSGNIIFTSTFFGTIDSDPGPGQSLLTSESSYQIFLVKLDRNGNFIFSRQFTSGGIVNPYALQTNTNGDIYIAGQYYGTFDLNPGPGVVQIGTESGQNAVFFTKLTASGYYDRGTGLLGAPGINRVCAIAIDLDNNVFLCGSANNTSVRCETHASMGSGDVFIVKLGVSNVATGTVFYDKNGDGKQNTGETGMRYVVVKSPANTHDHFDRFAITDSLGRYRLLLDTGSYNIILPDTSEYFTVSPLNNTVVYGRSLGQLDSNNNFSLYPKKVANDLKITVAGSSSVRHGVATKYYIICTNIGTTALSGFVQFQHDSNFGFVSAYPAEDSYTNPDVRWNLSNLLPFQTKQFDVILRLQPNVSLGNLLHSIATVTTSTQDNNLSDNQDTVTQIIKDSYDPNLKVVAPDGDITTQFISDKNYLDYTINFQNTGNDTAFNIVVQDTLSNNVDISSLQIISSSYPCTVTLDGTNHLQWYFNNISLPDSTTNEPLSHGFIRFKVRPLSGLAVGSHVYNTAAIYFDFNSQVLTNQTANTVVNNTLPISLLNFTGTLVNEETYLNWQTAQEINTSYFVMERSTGGNDFSKIGYVTASVNSSSVKNYSYVDQQPLQGINYYRLRIVDLDDEFTYSKIVIIKNDGNNSFKVFPNPANNILNLQAKGDNEFATLKIVDATGRILQEEKILLSGNIYKINIKNLPKGVYDLTLQNKIINKHQKFVKQ